MKQIEKALKYINARDMDKALPILETALKTAAPEEAFSIAELLYQLGYMEKSAEIMESLLIEFPGDSELITMLADIYIELGEDEKALDLLGNTPEDAYEGTEYLQMILQQADLYQTQGLFEVAEQKLLQGKQHHPNELILDFALGELLFSIGEYNRAIAYYEKVIGTHRVFADVSLSERLAEANAAAGHYESALDYYQQSNSEDPDFLFKYGFTAHQIDRNDIAIRVWKKLIEKDPDYVSVYHHLSHAYEDENMLNEAFETIQEGLKKDEYNKGLYYEAAVLAHQLGEEQKSEKFAREAIALDPDYKEAVLFLVGLLKNADRQEDIIELLIHIMENGAEDPDYDWELARAYNETEEYEEALKHYKKAYTHFEEDSEFLKEYGYFLAEEARIEEAVNVISAYMKLEPFDAEMQAFLERLANQD